MKVKTFQAIQCPECGEYFPAADTPHPIQVFQCGECEGIYPDKQNATQCCKD